MYTFVLLYLLIRGISCISNHRVVYSLFILFYLLIMRKHLGIGAFLSSMVVLSGTTNSSVAYANKYNRSGLPGHFYIGGALGGSRSAAMFEGTRHTYKRDVVVPEKKALLDAKEATRSEKLQSLIDAGKNLSAKVKNASLAHENLSNTTEERDVRTKQTALDTAVKNMIGSDVNGADANDVNVVKAKNVVNRLNDLNAAKAALSKTHEQKVVTEAQGVLDKLAGVASNVDATRTTDSIVKALAVKNALDELNAAKNATTPDNAVIAAKQAALDAAANAAAGGSSALSNVGAATPIVVNSIAISDALAALENAQSALDSTTQMLAVTNAQADLNLAVNALPTSDLASGVNADETTNDVVKSKEIVEALWSLDVSKAERDETAQAQAVKTAEHELLAESDNVDDIQGELDNLVTQESSDLNTAQSEALAEEKELDQAGDTAMIGFDRWRVGGNAELRTGYEIKRDKLYFAAEAFAQKLFANTVEASFTQSNGIANSSSVSVNYLYGFKGKVGANFSDKVSAYGIVGLARTHTEMRTNAITLQDHSYDAFSPSSKNDFGIVYGVGLSYQVTPKVSLTAECQLVHFLNGKIKTNAVPNIDNAAYESAKALYSPSFKDVGIQTIMFGANFLF